MMSARAFLPQLLHFRLEVLFAQLIQDRVARHLARVLDVLRLGLLRVPRNRVPEVRTLRQPRVREILNLHRLLVGAYRTGPSVIIIIIIIIMIIIMKMLMPAPTIVFCTSKSPIGTPSTATLGPI